MAWFLSPKRNAERRLQINIEYKKQKEQYNNVRYREVKHYKEEYEEYKKLAEQWVPIFFDEKELGVPSKSDMYDIEREIEHLERCEKWYLLNDIRRLSTDGFIRYKVYFNDEEYEMEMMLLVDEDIEVNKKMHEIKEKISKINIKIQELKEKYEEVKKIKDEKDYLVDKMVKDNKYLQDLFINMININNFMIEYDMLCKENNINEMYSKKAIKKMYKNYKLYKREMEINYNNMLYARGRIL